MKPTRSACGLWSGAVAILLGPAVPAGAQPPAAAKLNVLFIVSDDMNCQLGCYGNPAVRSPNIDRLAARGVRFERAYCNYPVCNASRTSFLSGRYPDTTHVFGNATDPRVRLGPEFQFLPEYFRAHGYYTAGVGKVAHGAFASSVKWDFFAEPMRGIDEDDVKAAPKKGAAQKKRAAEKKAARKPDGGGVPFAWQATANADEDEPDGNVARRVVKLLEQHKDGPFFIAAGFHKPHVPHTAPKKYFHLYPPAKMPLPDEPAGHAKNIPDIAHPPKYFPDLSDTQKRQIIAHYYAATTFMDAQVGLLLEAMDRLKLWDNTVVVFLGDHGWHHGEHAGFWAKMSVMEESARAPLIVAAPGKKTSAVSSRLVEFVDLFPTLTEMCRLPAAAGVEGTTFAPLLDDPQRPWKKAVFTVVRRPDGLGRAVRTETHTYIEWPNGSAQLYDHTRDAKEFVNLAKDPAHAQTVAELKQLLKEGWQAARPPTAN
jgi:iduronate 2-sulfatase